MIHVRTSDTALAAMHLDDPEVQDTFGVTVNALGRGSNVIKGDAEAIRAVAVEIAAHCNTVTDSNHSHTVRTALRVVLRTAEKELRSQ